MTSGGVDKMRSQQQIQRQHRQRQQQQQHGFLRSQLAHEFP